MNNKLITTQATIQGKYPRSRWPFNFRHMSSFNAGDLTVLSCTEILPGDTVNMSVHSLVRMATPIAPLMSTIKQDIWFFFVPRRLLESNWDEFISYSDWDSLNSATVDIIPPSFIGMVQPGSIADHIGLPIGVYTDKMPDIIAAPFKGVNLIYNYFFRDENYQNELSLDYFENTELWFQPNVLHVNEFHDVFTSVLPSPQKGPEVLLPLSGSAPVMIGDEFGPQTLPVKFSAMSNILSPETVTGAGNGTIGLKVGNHDLDAYASINGLVADLSRAVSASINDLRSSVLVQHFMEQLARSGSRLQEYYLGFWGVRSPDARLQIPEYIAGTRFNINVSEVLQTTGYNESNNTTLGTTGAVSRTGNSSRSLFTKSFVEHGYLFALTAVRHDLSYSQGLSKMFTKTKAFDYYVPTFNGLGEVEVKKSEILAPVGYNNSIMKDDYQFAGTDISKDDILGFNEPWYEYRFRPSRASGILNPVAKDGLDYWTLTKAFTSSNITGASIRVSDRSTLDRALSTASTTDQFIIDYLEEADITRVMPTRSIPGISKL